MADRADSPSPPVSASITCSEKSHCFRSSYSKLVPLPPLGWEGKRQRLPRRLQHPLHFARVDIELVGNFLGQKVESFVEPIVLVTAAVGIALRLYLLTAVLFDFKPLGAKFKRLYPCVLPLDMLWALAPFLLVSRIGIGAAFAACAASPFAAITAT